jgi:hypothetical protein
MKCAKRGELEDVLTIKQRRLNTEYLMFTSDVIEGKTKEIEQEKGKAYFTIIIDVHVSSDIDKSYRSL